MTGIEPVFNLLRQSHGTYGINESNLYNNRAVLIPWLKMAGYSHEPTARITFEN